MSDIIKGYCMKCKEKNEMKNVEFIVMKNGCKRASGNCMHCNCKVSAMMKKNKEVDNKEAEQYIQRKTYGL